MSIHNGTIINQLFKKWPYATVATSAWLAKAGVNRQLVEYYVQSHWLEPIGHGAYIKSGESVEWMGGLFAIQTQCGLPIHVGAKTALEVQHLGHFLPMGRQKVSLFGLRNIKLPSWYQKHIWNMDLHYVRTQLFTQDIELGLTQYNSGSFEIVCSAPERAILEVLYLIPHRQSFEEAYYLMEGLGTLRPKLVQSLLETCSSIKVKRIFLFLARCCHHAWLDQLNFEPINLGVGKRIVQKQGILDKEFLITVPKMFSTLRKNLSNEELP